MSLKEVGPSKRIGVVLAVLDGLVGARIEEHLHDILVRMPGRQVQRRHRRIPVIPAAARIGAVVEQPADRLGVAALGGQVQRAVAGAAGREHLRVLAEQPLGGLPVAERQQRREVEDAAVRRSMAALALESSASVMA